MLSQALSASTDQPFAPNQQALLSGDVLISTRPHTLTGAAVTAQMYLPLVRSQIWTQLTDYSRWVHYFPDIVHSQVVEPVLEAKASSRRVTRRLYQVARKAFLLFSAQVEVHLQVVESMNQCIQFRLERGNFSDFAADLVLEDFQQGTLLTYSVRATPLIPAPSFLIQEAMRQDLPGNMRTMRQVLCQPSASS
ncbi:MAG: cyclase [Leptolyngbya sp. SIO4C1]|nr:cyclase [Leptolyngbya sp. SIO4C1]